jgi:hypothetical protein
LKKKRGERRATPLQTHTSAYVYFRSVLPAWGVSARCGSSSGSSGVRRRRRRRRRSRRKSRRRRKKRVSVDLVKEVGDERLGLLSELLVKRELEMDNVVKGCVPVEEVGLVKLWNFFIFEIAFGEVTLCPIEEDPIHGLSLVCPGGVIVADWFLESLYKLKSRTHCVQPHLFFQLSVCCLQSRLSSLIPSLWKLPLRCIDEAK